MKLGAKPNQTTRVLYYDDNDAPSQLQAKYELYEIADVTLVQKANEAFSRLEKERFDLFLVDLVLDHDEQAGSCLAVVQKALALRPNLFIVIVTHSDDRSLIKPLLRAGAADFLSKGLLFADDLILKMPFWLNYQRRVDPIKVQRGLDMKKEAVKMEFLHILELKRQGLKGKEICKRLKISFPTLKKILLRHGLSVKNKLIYFEDRWKFLEENPHQYDVVMAGRRYSKVGLSQTAIPYKTTNQSNQTQAL